MDGYVTDMTAYETVDYLTKIQVLLQKELVGNCGYTLKFDDEADVKTFISFVDQLKCALQKYKKDFMGI